jgi:hypothetical protein
MLTSASPSTTLISTENNLTAVLQSKRSKDGDGRLSIIWLDGEATSTQSKFEQMINEDFFFGVGKSPTASLKKKEEKTLR